MTVLRVISGFLLGVFLAFLTVALVQRLGHMVFSPPPDLDVSDARALSAALDTLPLGALLFVVVAWALGAFAGSALASHLAPHAKPWLGLGIGLAVLAATGVTLFSIPHPIWMTVAGLIVPLPAAWLGTRVVEGRD